MHGESAFLGLSIGSHAFSERFFSCVQHFAAQNSFAGVAVVIADEPHKFSFMALRGMSEKDALSAVRRIGEEKHKFLLRTVADSPQFTIYRWSQLSRMPMFRQIAMKLEYHWRSSVPFRDVVSERFLDHLKEVGGPTHISRESVTLGCNYILHELAMMLFFYEGIAHLVQIAPFPTPEFLSYAYRSNIGSEVAFLANRGTLIGPRLHVRLGEESGGNHTSAAIESLYLPPQNNE